MAEFSCGYGFLNGVPVVTDPGTTQKGGLYFQVQHEDLRIAVLCAGSAANLTVSKGNLVSIHGGIFKKSDKSDFALLVSDLRQISVCVVDFGFVEAE